jgi:hypothetical protein
MGVSVMRDKKLKLTDPKASHTLGSTLGYAQNIGRADRLDRVPMAVPFWGPSWEPRGKLL